MKKEIRQMEIVPKYKKGPRLRKMQKDKKRS